MDILNQQIALMDRKEVKNFKIFIERGWQQNDRKDVALFDILRKSKAAYNEEKTFKKLYKGNEKNAYYRLRNRLSEDINLSLFEQNYKDDHNMHCLYLLAMGYYFASKNSYKLALYQLKKAEKKALAAENYSLLDVVYGKLIHASREVLNEDPEKYIKRRRENRNLLVKMGEIDDVLEAVEYNMMISQNMSGKKQNVLEGLNATLEKYALDKELQGSARLQFGIYFIVSRILLQSNDYLQLEEYLINTYKQFTKNALFNKSNHAHKLQMLSWISNALFMNKKYNQSLEFAEILKHEMEMYDALYYKRFELFYYSSLVNNFSVINAIKAIAILEDLTQKEKIQKLSFNAVFVYLNLAVLYYGQKDYTKALKNINRIYNYEGYKNTDERLKLRIALGELMMRHERNEREIIDYRLKQVAKDFAETLKNDAYWESAFLEFINHLNINSGVRAANNIQQTANKLLQNMHNNSGADDMLFAYDLWLKEKAHLA